jgi:hypothetical protein
VAEGFFNLLIGGTKNFFQETRRLFGITVWVSLDPFGFYDRHKRDLATALNPNENKLGTVMSP